MTPDVLPLTLIAVGLVTLAVMARYGWRKRRRAIQDRHYYGIPAPSLTARIHELRATRCARGIHDPHCGHQWDGPGDAA